MDSSSVGARDLVYVTGDTVWFEGVADVARHFSPGVVVAFAGAAKTRGALRLTMDANDVIELAHAFPAATIVAAHVDGWRHFTESRQDLEAAFRTLHLESRFRSLQPGETIALDVPADTFV